MKNIGIFVLTLILSLAVSTVNSQRSIESLGALEFSDEGVLFAGDNLLGAIHAIDLKTETRAKEKI